MVKVLALKKHLIMIYCLAQQMIISNLKLVLIQEIELNGGSYIIFESLMKLIVGRFVLTGDYKDEFCMLPDDFIDLETKTITWHSDSGVDNVLKLQYDEKSIKLFIMKSKNDNVVNTVRIRTDGSSYGYYYQEFEKFFKELYSFALSYSPEVMTPNNESPKRKLLLFGKKTPRK